MKKKIIQTLLTSVLVVSVVLSGTGCTKEEPKKEPVKTERPKEDPVQKLKKVVPKIEQMKVVENAKNLDMNKVMEKLVDKSVKEDVAAIIVDDSGLDETKKGTYEVTITITMKENSEKQEMDKESISDTSEENPESSDKKEDVGVIQKEESDQSEPEEESKEESEKEDTVISGTVDVEVVDKESVEEHTEKGDVIITDDNQIIEKPESEKTPEKDESVKEEKPDKTPSENKDSVEAKPQSESKDPEEPKPEPSKPTVSVKPSEPQSSAPQPSVPQQKPCSHAWVQQYTSKHHEATGHYEQKWVVDTPAWDEPVYESHNFCNKCGADLGQEDPTVHVAICRSSYHAERVQTGSIHHDEVGHYESNWVVDNPAWDEQIPNGYKCSKCNATK